MTRTPRHPETGKPIPRAIADQGIPEFIEEETKPDLRIPSADELEDELAQHSGDAAFWRRR